MNNLPAGLIASMAAMLLHPPWLMVERPLISGDLGPNISVRGLIATILWLQAVRRAGADVGFWQFLKVGTITIVPAPGAALAIQFLIGAFGKSHQGTGLAPGLS